MSDKPETLAAVLAEMRDYADHRAADAGGERPAIELLRSYADRIDAAVQRFVADDCAKCAHYNAATISLKDALDLANTIANHGISATDLGDKASATIYALCHEVRTVRGEDTNIKQEVQKLRRELRDLRRVPGNAAAMREALVKLTDAVRNYFGWDDAPAVHDVDDSTAYFCAEKSAALAAIAAPARNCDVGTPEEQFELFSAFCKSGRQWDDEDYCSSKCPLDKRGGGCEVGCAFHWAQMPFAPAEGGKE